MLRVILLTFGFLVLAVVALLAWQRTQINGPDNSSAPTSPSQGFSLQGPSAGPTLEELEARLPEAPYRILTRDPALLARGEEVYRTSCAVCHGTNLEGQPNWWIRDAQGNLPAPPHDKTGHTWHHSDEVLFNLVKYGPGVYTPGYSGKMPAYEALLEDRDIQAVNSWIASTWPTEVLLAQRERTLASEPQQ